MLNQKLLTDKLLTLSDLKVIGPERINPHADEAERLAELYCREHRIWLPHLAEYTTMSRYLHPDATLERLTTIVVIYNFLYYIDDIHTSDRNSAEDEDDTEMQQIYRNFVPILMYGRMPKEHNPLYASCKLIRELILESASEAWLWRIVSSLIKHLNASTLSVQAIMVDGVASIDKYIELREFDSGMQSTVEMIELEMGIFIPDEILAHPVLEQLRVCVMRLGSLMNDLFSYHKEVIMNGQRFNLVSVLMENRNLSFEAAAHESIKIVNGFTQTFLEYEQKVPEFSDPEINRMVKLYVQGCRNEILAIYHWQMSTNRYRSPDSPFPELRVLL
jgi:hypothetical protein